MLLVHLDVGACVGVWHSDAVMQPGPRDGRGSTNGAPMGWLMIILLPVLSSVPEKRIHYYFGMPIMACWTATDRLWT